MSSVDRYHAALREIGCIVCLRHLHISGTPAAIHHCGAPHDRNDWYVLPICHEHHQGKSGYHGLGGESGFVARYKFGEARMLAWTTEEYVKRRRA